LFLERGVDNDDDNDAAVVVVVGDECMINSAIDDDAVVVYFDGVALVCVEVDGEGDDDCIDVLTRSQ
jgi:hypothetical protein